MKRCLFSLICGISATAFIASADVSLAQTVPSPVNSFGPPTFTGVTVQAPAESFAWFRQQVPEEEGVFQNNVPTILQVWPNPSAGMLRISLASALSNPAQVSLVNMNGETMMTEFFNPGMQTLSMDVSSLPVGLYALQIEAGGVVPESIPFIKATE